MSEKVVHFMKYLHEENEPIRFPGRVEAMTLREEEQGGARTILVRLPPGGTIQAHCHLAPVQHFLLGGDYELEGESYDAGAYQLFPAHAELGEITSKQGALLLIVFDPTESAT